MEDGGTGKGIRRSSRSDEGGPLPDSGRGEPRQRVSETNRDVGNVRVRGICRGGTGNGRGGWFGANLRVPAPWRRQFDTLAAALCNTSHAVGEKLWESKRELGGIELGTRGARANGEEMVEEPCRHFGASS